MKKEYVILAIIITAAIVGVGAFTVGSLLTNPQKNKIAAQLSKMENDLSSYQIELKQTQAKLEQAEITNKNLNQKLNDSQNELMAVNSKLEETEITNKDLAQKLNNNQNELLAIKSKLKEKQKETELSKKPEETITPLIPEPNNQIAKGLDAPIKKVNKSIFGIYLGEKLSDLQQRFSVTEISSSQKPPLLNMWLVHNNVNAISYCGIATFDDLVISVMIRFNDTSEANFKAIATELEKTYGVKGEEPVLLLDQERNYIVKIDSTTVAINLELKKGFNENTLTLIYSHFPLTAKYEAAVQAQKASTVAGQL